MSRVDYSGVEIPFGEGYSLDQKLAYLRQQRGAADGWARPNRLRVTFRWRCWALPFALLVSRGYWSFAVGPWTFERRRRRVP